MRIYFVRHGSTNANTSAIFQLTSEPLSPKGISEAHLLAERCRALSIGAIFSSPSTRAVQTAQSIGSQLGMPIQTNELFEEIRRPSEVRGKSKSDPEVRRIMNLVASRFSEGTWTYSDEENFVTSKSRAELAIDFLAQTAKTNLMVVTHGEILRLILGVVLFSDDLTPELFDRIKRSVAISNSAITEFELIDGKWRLLTWNNCPHHQ